MITYKLIAVYGLNCTDKSRSEYKYPTYFIFDPSSDTLLEHSFDNASEAISFIYSLIKIEGSDLKNEFSPPAHINIEMTNVVFSRDSEYLYEPNKFLPLNIQQVLTDSIKKHLAKYKFKL